MACCLTLAILVALVRKVLPRRRRASEFAPPAYRAATDRGAALTPALERLGRPTPSTGQLLRAGLALGVFAYSIDALALTVAGTMTADLVVRGVLVAAAGLAVARAWPSTGRILRPADGPLVLGVAGLSFGLFGLLEMHALGTIAFASPSIVSDLAFHLAGPALASGAAILLVRASATDRVVVR